MLKQHQTSIAISASFIIMLAMFWVLPQVAFVVFIAVLLDLLLHPFVDRLERLRLLPRSAAVAISLICFCLIVIVLFTVISTTLADSLQKFSEDLPQINASIRSLLESSEFITNELDNLWSDITRLSITMIRASLSTVLDIFSRVFDVVIILFTAFYLLKDGRQIQKWLARLFPSRDHLRVFRLIDHILSALHTYIVSQLAICFIMGIVVFIYFSWCGLPYAAIFAVFSGISEFVPVIGPTIASAFGTAITATFSRQLAIQTLLFYIIITQINHNFIYPSLIGKTLGIHPIVILLGILIGGCVLNAAGMFLAIPFIVMIRIVILDIHGSLNGKPRLPRAVPRRKTRQKVEPSTVD